MTRVQLFEASTAYQVMVLAAAIDSGTFEPADERILLLSVNTPVPEVAASPDASTGIASLLGRFHRVLSLNDLLAPLHPAAFRPRPADQPLFERLLRAAIGIPDDASIELVVESVQAPPSRSLVLVFGAADITAYAEGLMSYGPTREPLPPQAAGRVRRVVHLDLVAGLRPLLLNETGAPAVAVPDAAFRRVVVQVAAASDPPGVPAEPYALVLGQYLAQIGLISEAEEAALVADLIRAATARGIREVVVKPHPSAPPEVAAAAARAVPEAHVTVLQHDAPAEALYATRPPALVLGCFSTGLVTATRYWDIPAVTFGARRLLAALPRFQDSNRVPLAIVDALLPGAAGSVVGTVEVAVLQRRLEAIGYCMQWRSRALWRDEAAAVLAADRGALEHVVPRSRLRLLGLPGGWPLTVPRSTFESASSRAEQIWALGQAVRRRLAR